MYFTLLHIFVYIFWDRKKSNSVTFDAKKAKETLRRRLSRTQLLKQTEKSAGWKTPLNPQALACFENSAKSPPSCSSLFHLVTSGFYRQVDVRWYFSAIESTYWGHNGCQSSWNDERRVNARSWSIWRIFMRYFIEKKCFATFVNLFPK